MLAIILDLMLIAVVIYLVVQNERIERKLARSLNEELDVTVEPADLEYLEEYLARTLDARPATPRLTVLRQP